MELPNLRAWRTANGVTLEETAALLGISESMLSRIERGERRLAPLVAIRVSRLTGVPVRRFLGAIEASAGK
jgi:transcriptional regulator with XRE-family HTH domain